MNTLEEHLIQKIHAEVSRLWAVADGDGLFRNDEVARLLSERGAEVVQFEDPMAFRFIYEHEIRPRIDSGAPGCHVIVFEPGNDGSRCLPADIYETSHKIEVALGDVFPTLSRKVMRDLEPSVVSMFWEKKDQIPAVSLGDRDTADLVLRIGYRIDTTLISSFQDLVHALTVLHFSGRHLPETLASRLEQVAGGPFIYGGIIPGLIRSPGAFWEFLQHRWEDWLIPSDEKGVKDLSAPSLSFEDSCMRVLVDNLFSEGFLTPLPATAATKELPHEWCRVGIASKGAADDNAELAEKHLRLIEAIPAEDASYQEWLRYCFKYSSHVAALFSQDRTPDLTDAFWGELWDPLDARFHEFAKCRMESLQNLPPTRPVVGHHIAPFLARRVRANKKVALLVLDGLSLSQWKAVRRELEGAIPGMVASEDACFTLVPSVTNVCRQTIYSGELPVFFEPTITRTDVDGKRWRSFWDGACDKPVKSQHLNIEGQDTDLQAVRDAIDSNPVALGITIRMPDEIMHGATMGWRGMFEQIRLWGRQKFLAGAIGAILDAGYELFLTSDHGNIEAKGEGSPSQGVLVDRSGQRQRTYNDPTIFAHSATQIGSRAYPFQSKSLPASYLPLIHTGRGAFVYSGQSLVCHGGMSLDEMVIPFIQLSAAKHS
jgi:hypothetical protein